MKYSREVHRSLEAGRKRRDATEATFYRHSQNYAEVLKLSAKDIDELIEGDTPEFLRFTVNGTEFSLHAEQRLNERTWSRGIMAICRSDDTINSSVGGGTTFHSIITEDWHTEVIHHLAGEVS